MKPTSIPDSSDRRGTGATSAEPPPSFEALLERLLATPASSADGSTGLQAALDLIAAFFSADRAVLRLDTGTESTPEGLALELVEAPGLEVPVAVAGHEPIGTAALHAPGRKEPWTDRDADRLRLAAWTLCDVLQKQRIESELREQRIWLLMAMNSAVMGVWDWDVASDHVRFVSPFDARCDGLRIRETTGSSWFDTTHPEDVAVSRPEVDRAISGETDEFAMVVRQRVELEQDVRWAHIYSRGRVIERDATGWARRMMGTFEDVTEANRKAEAEKARDAAMAHATRMASLGIVATSLAHDLNQPLTALTSFLEGAVRLISRGQATEADVVEALERSVSFAHRASDIVRRFRQLLQRESPLRDPVDLSSLLHGVRERMKREAAAAGVEIALPPELAPVVVRGDSLQLEQLVTSLVRNAIEALADHGRSHKLVTLDVRVEDRLAEVRVSDNGPGIPDRVVDRLFKPLATSREAGRGLGLAIGHSIAEIHGGRLRVERTGANGTTFVLALPSDNGGRP
jgi:signal transduction histidine kinase